MDLIEELNLKAAKYPKRIVFPEGEDGRIVKAAGKIAERKTGRPVLLGDENLIKKVCRDEDVDPGTIEIINPAHSNNASNCFQRYIDIIKPKQAIINKVIKANLASPLYYGAAMVKIREADGLVAGATNTSADVIKACLRIIGPSPGVHTVSSFFVMLIPDCSYGNNGVFLFADAGVNTDPNPDALASIALSSAKSAKDLLNFEPKIAMLSFSTKGSSRTPMVNKVIEATEIVKQKAPGIIVDGELQMDAALVPEIARIKAPGSKVAGHANVLIFPDLNAGNITYKAVERLAKAQAFGPIFQGLSRPASDLSRGCSVSDIITTAAIVAIKAQIEK